MAVRDAAVLIIGALPGEYETRQSLGHEMDPSDEVRYFSSLEAARNAVLDGLLSFAIAGEIISSDKTVSEAFDNFYERTSATARHGISFESTVNVDSLKNWLKSRGVFPTFFFPEHVDSPHVDSPEYLDPENPRYAPKLAAAIAAWQAVEPSEGTSVKQALKVWLRKNANSYRGLSKDGILNDTAIDEIAKVANWHTVGGAPKTPASKK